MVVLQTDPDRARKPPAARCVPVRASRATGHFTRMGFADSDLDGLIDELVDRCAWAPPTYTARGQRNTGKPGQTT